MDEIGKDKKEMDNEIIRIGVLDELREVMEYLYDNSSYYRRSLKTKLGEDEERLDDKIEELSKIEDKWVRSIIEKEIESIKKNRGLNLLNKYRLLFSDNVLIKTKLKSDPKDKE